MRVGDVIVLCVVFLLLVSSAIFYFVRRNKGKGHCGGCSSCPYSSERCEKCNKNEIKK